MNMLARLKRPFTAWKGRNWTGAELISAAFPMVSMKTSVTIENGQLTSGVMYENPNAAS